MYIWFGMVFFGYVKKSTKVFRKKSLRLNSHSMQILWITCGKLKFLFQTCCCGRTYYNRINSSISERLLTSRQGRSANECGIFIPVCLTFHILILDTLVFSYLCLAGTHIIYLFIYYFFYSFIYLPNIHSFIFNQLIMHSGFLF